MKLYFKFVAMHLKSELSYPSAFVMSCIGRVVYTAANLFSIFLLMSRFGVVAGHSLGEILLGFGVVMTAANISECFARGFDAFGKVVRQAQFDRLMVRPRSLVFQVMCQDLRPASMANILLGAAVIAYAISLGEIAWTPAKALVLGAMVLCGSLLFFGAYMVYAALCFYTLEGLEVMNIFTDGVREFSRYPYDVYGKGVLWFTTVLMPMALVQYWPLRYLVGQGPWWYGLLPIVSLWFLLPCYAIWRRGVAHYCSAGS